MLWMLLLLIYLPDILWSLSNVFALKKTFDHFMNNLGANMIEHVSEMEMYNISTLEKFEN